MTDCIAETACNIGFLFPVIWQGFGQVHDIRTRKRLIAFVATISVLGIRELVGYVDFFNGTGFLSGRLEVRGKARTSFGCSWGVRVDGSQERVV